MPVLPVVPVLPVPAPQASSALRRVPPVPLVAPPGASSVPRRVLRRVLRGAVSLVARPLVVPSASKARTKGGYDKHQWVTNTEIT